MLLVSVMGLFATALLQISDAEAVQYMDYDWFDLSRSLQVMIQVENITCGFADVAAETCTLEDLCASLRESRLTANGQSIECSTGTETTWEVSLEFPQRCVNRPETGTVVISDASMIDPSSYGECVIGTRTFLFDYSAFEQETRAVGYRQIFRYVAPTQNMYVERITPPETCKEESQIQILDALPFCTYGCEHIDSFHLNGLQCSFSCQKCFLGRDIKPQIDCSNIEPNLVSTCRSRAQNIGSVINYPGEFPYEPSTSSATKRPPPLALLSASTLSVIFFHELVL